MMVLLTLWEIVTWLIFEKCRIIRWFAWNMLILRSYITAYQRVNNWDNFTHVWRWLDKMTVCSATLSFWIVLGSWVSRESTFTFFIFFLCVLLNSDKGLLMEAQNRCHKMTESQLVIVLSSDWTTTEPGDRPAGSTQVIVHQIWHPGAFGAFGVGICRWSM